MLRCYFHAKLLPNYNFLFSRNGLSNLEFTTVYVPNGIFFRPFHILYKSAPIFAQHSEEMDRQEERHGRLGWEELKKFPSEDTDNRAVHR